MQLTWAGCSVVKWLQESYDETKTKINSQTFITQSFTGWLWQTDFQ